MSKVSVIIAAYNADKYILQTIESVINQTLNDIEIIVVDDGSTDNTLEIVKRCAKKDKRIKTVINEKNMGTSLARVCGVKNATSEYIMFLDGDDILVENACEKAYEAIDKENTDVVQFGVDVFSEADDLTEDKRKEMKELFIFIPETVRTTSKSGLHVFSKDFVRISLTVWNKIYSAKLLKKACEFIPDKHLIYAEDWMFSYITLGMAKSYSHIDDELIKYRFGTGISTTDEFTRSGMDSVAKTYYIYKYLEKWTKENADINDSNFLLNHMKNSFLANIGYSFLVRCSDIDREYYLERILEYCPIEEFTAIISFVTYAQRVCLPDKTSAICESLAPFKLKKKKIKTIGAFYFRLYNGGIESVLSGLMDIWVKNGYNVVLFTDEKPNESDYYINPSVKRVILPNFKNSTLDEFEERVKAWKTAIEENQIDAMVYNAWLHKYLVSEMLAIKSTGAALIMHTHSIFCSDVQANISHDAILGNLIYKMYRLADNTVTLSKVDQAWWNACGVRNVRSINPMRMDLNTSVSKLNGNTILYVGRISVEKQVTDVIKIVSKVRESVPDVKLVILGTRDDKGYFKTVMDCTRDYKMDDCVEFAGYQKNVIPYYQSADVMLCTSKFEGFGLSLIESKVCGLPLVTYDLPNLDIIREKKGMYVISQNDITAAAEKIVNILTNPELKVQMGKEARNSAVEMYNLDLAKKWDEIFKGALVSKENFIQEIDMNALQTAMSIFINSNVTGIQNRDAFLVNELNYYIPRAEMYEREFNYYRREFEYYFARCKEYEDALNENGKFNIYKLAKIVYRRAKSILRK